MKKSLRMPVTAIIVLAVLTLASCKKDSIQDSVQNSNSPTSTDGNGDGRGGGGNANRGGGGGAGGTGGARMPNLNHLNENLYVFTNASEECYLQGATTHGHQGDIAVNSSALLKTSGIVPYAGTIKFAGATAGDWQPIIDANAGQANAMVSLQPYLDGLKADLESAFDQVNAMPVTTGYDNLDPESLNGLNTQDGIGQTFVFNITQHFHVQTSINITGDANDVYIFRWDKDKNPANGYNGIVFFHGGTAIIPHGGLIASNFIHVAGEIQSTGGGSVPPAPYPQGPRFNGGTEGLINGGTDFNGRAYYTGYWLTTGKPTIFPTNGDMPYGPQTPVDNAAFVGGWYTTTTKVSMVAYTSGVFVDYGVFSF